mmetsp:Transcript_105524/g.298218  ORF Transcript_105524/g.298218 Transcript_105524/m.298218 type:complete len:226 (+) Transcript_105524:686-1363(+)
MTTVKKVRCPVRRWCGCWSDSACSSVRPISTQSWSAWWKRRRLMQRAALGSRSSSRCWPQSATTASIGGGPSCAGSSCSSTRTRTAKSTPKSSWPVSWVLESWAPDWMGRLPTKSLTSSDLNWEGASASRSSRTCASGWRSGSSASPPRGQYSLAGRWVSPQEGLQSSSGYLTRWTLTAASICRSLKSSGLPTSSCPCHPNSGSWRKSSDPLTRMETESWNLPSF